jgi:hypothetical protein
MRQTNTLPLPSVPLGLRVFAGCCESLLDIGPSRRYLCGSFPTCLHPYPGSSCGALTRFFPQDFGLPRVRTGSALSYIHTATSVWACFRGCNHSLMFRPAGLLATPIAPTAAPLSAGQPWLLRPRLSRFVTSPCSGYARRLNRVIDGMGPFTPQDPQPCRLLPSAVGTPVTRRPPHRPGRAVFPHPVPRLHSLPRRPKPSPVLHLFAVPRSEVGSC